MKLSHCDKLNCYKCCKSKPGVVIEVYGDDSESLRLCKDCAMELYKRLHTELLYVWAGE